MPELNHSSDAVTPSDDSAGASRRSLLRTAAVGAWSAPIIVAVAAAPSLAASGPAAVTTQATSSAHSNGAMAVSINYTNTNTRGTGVTTVTVTFTPGTNPLGGTFGTIKTTTPVITSGGDWVASMGTTSGNNTTFVFTSSSGIPGAATATGTGSKTLGFTVQVMVNGAGLSSGSFSVATTPSMGSVTNPALASLYT